MVILGKTTAFGSWLQRHLEQSTVTAKGAWIDAGVLLIILTIGNYLFDPENPGWIDAHPSPYFLLPVLLGCRYGFAAGFWGGMAAASLICLLMARIDLSEYAIFIADHRYFLLAFPSCGGVCGEVQSILSKRLAQKTMLLEQTSHRLRQLDEEIYLLRESKDEVERMLAVMDAESATLDFEIRRLYQCAEDRLYSNLLNLLGRKVSLQEAAFYQVEKGGDLKRAAFLGRSETFPERMSPAQNKIVAKALEEKEMVTLKEVWDPTFKYEENFLIAVPLLTRKEIPFAILLISRMPLSSLHRRSIHTLHLICRWATHLIGERSEAGEDFRFVGKSGTQRIYSEDYLAETLDLAFRTYRNLRLTSSLVVFCSPEQPVKHQELLEGELIPLFRFGDMAARFDSETPNVALFLPLTGKRGALLASNRIQKTHTETGLLPLRTEVFLLEEWNGPDHLLEKIHRGLRRQSE